jgi:hypothetical protein
MTRIRYILLPLLLAGFACAQAQPIVKNNPGSTNAAFPACDVIGPTPPNIITIDPTTGNVVITGSLVLASDHTTACAGSTGGGGGGGGTFAFATPLNTSPSQFQAQSGSSAFS